MASVIKFPVDRSMHFWQCDCDCVTHYVRADGAIECAQCGTVANGGERMHGLWVPDVTDAEEVDGDEPAA